MKRILGITLISALSFSAIAATDVFQQLGVSKNTAASELLTSLQNGDVNYAPVRKAFRAATPEARAAMTEQVLVWAKAYLSSPQFAAAYKKERDASKPEYEKPELSIDEELKARREERGPNPILDTPDFQKLERDALKMERDQMEASYKVDLARWEKEYPADPKSLIKLRLEEFLDQTENVDFEAEVVDRGGRKKFARAAYENKAPNWKLAYRAGEAATGKARAFAQSWLDEL